MTRKPALLGSAIGLALFLATALLPTLVYGGYAGVMLAGGLFGTPLAATFATRAIVVGGMVCGVTFGAALFAVLGAAVSVAAAALVRAVPEREASSAA